MDGPVKTRSYTSPRRAEQAARTRRAVLHAARDLFTRDGYAETPVSAVARTAGVSVDTVYTSVGRKPELLLAVVDMALAGGDEPLPAEERDYVRAVRAERTATGKLAVYAAALGSLMPRVGPLLLALRHAAGTDPGCAETWQRVNRRRRDNMLLLAEDLRGTGELRPELGDDEVADLLWMTNAVEFYELAAARGRAGRDFAGLVLDLWTRTLLG